MPDILRFPTRMDCAGIDLVSVIDRMPPGSFPFLNNVRVIQEGRIDGRPGYTQAIPLNDPPNSIRRLNDPDKSFAPSGYIYVGGGAGNLYAGVENNYVGIDNGFSGNPLSLIPFRPDQSPESWMYVYDANKQEKVRPDKEIRPIGYAPPTTAPIIEYGVPASVDMSDGQDLLGWVNTGIDSAVNLNDRTNSSSPTIASITYNSGPTGWCCINAVLIGQPFWVGERMRIILNSGQPNQETVTVRNVLPSIPASSISGIQYDAGNSGLCSMTLTGSPAGLDRNSLIQIDTEVVRVLEVNLAPNGTDYSIRCSTQNPHVAGASVTGLVSWYVYTALHHIAGEPISAKAIFSSHSTTGTGGIAKTVAVNAATAAGRPIDAANDYLHISLFIQNPQSVTEFQLLVSMDTTPNFSFDNPGNSFIWTIPQAALNTQGSSGDSWVEVVIPIAQGVRHGSDLTRTLANITGLAVQLVSTGGCSWGFDWWYLFGTYGPLIQPNSPTGYVYQVRYRDSTTGARSVPGPQTRYQLFPLRESVLNTLGATIQAGVDSYDIYRDGGTITSPLYVGTIGAVGSFLDTLPDLQVIQTNQPPDLTALQPWPTEQLSWVGVCNIVGTSVVWVSGSRFNTALVGDTIITIDGTAFLTFGQPRSTTFLEITQDGGNKTNVVFQVSAPILAGQPLPYVFGPLEGPFAPTVFGLGDTTNGGLLYFSNFNDADSASDANTVELTTPSAELVSGAVWNGMCFAGNRDDVFVVRFSYLTTIGASNSNSFQWARVTVPSGIWSRWACCACPLGMAYLGRDGLYICTESGGKNITDERLYPLFPHAGEPAKTIIYGDRTIYPVDMTKLASLRLSYCDEELRFCYVDINGTYQTLIFQIYRNRWFFDTYADSITYHYLVELPEAAPNDQEILMLSVATKEIVKAGGNTDNSVDIQSAIMLPSDDSKDDRAQKLYVDSMVQADGSGPLTVRATFNSSTVYSAAQTFTCQNLLRQFLINLASQSNLALYRNIGALISWTGGPSGPRVYTWDATGFAQPILTSFFVTQVNPFSFPGWKHMRRSYPALISQGPVDMTILAQDGRTYGPFTIPSTQSAYRIFPQILAQNIKDLAFSLQLDGHGIPFALFLQDFTIEVKEWNEETYIKLAVFRA